MRCDSDLVKLYKAGALIKSTRVNPRVAARLIGMTTRPSAPPMAYGSKASATFSTCFDSMLARDDSCGAPLNCLRANAKLHFPHGLPVTLTRYVRPIRQQNLGPSQAQDHR